MVLPFGLGDKIRLAQQILAQYSGLSGSTPHDAKVTFVKYAEQSPLYGCAWYSVGQSQFKEYSSVLLLAISAKGVMLVDPARRVFRSRCALCILLICLLTGDSLALPIRAGPNLGTHERAFYCCRRELQ
jgi:uncharacterized membrane protein (UPF0136 family)